MMDKQNFNAIAILDEPIELDGTVYAFMYDKEFEKQYDGRPFKSMSDYIAYHKGLSVWLAKMGPDSVSDDLDTFDYGNGVCLSGAKRFMYHVLTALFRGEAKYEVYEFDAPIHYELSEVDNEEPRAVVSRTLVDRIKNSVKSDD